MSAVVAQRLLLAAARGAGSRCATRDERDLFDLGIINAPMSFATRLRYMGDPRVRELMHEMLVHHKCSTLGIWSRMRGDARESCFASSASDSSPFRRAVSTAISICFGSEPVRPKSVNSPPPCVCHG